MNISVIIADTDREYVERLSEILQQRDEFTLQICTSEERLLTVLGNAGNRKAEIVLFDPDITEKKLTFSEVRLPICLYSEDSRNIGMYADFVKIMKYQRISNIYKQMLQEYSERAGYYPELEHSQKTALIGVYSPAGGSGKTTVALAIASKFVNNGKSVLFLSAEQLSSSSAANPGKEEGITALLSSVTKEQVNFELKLKGLMKSGLNGMSYVEGFERIVDYSAATRDEVRQVLERIKNCGVCDVVVIDMESNLDFIGQTILELSDRIVLVERPGELPFIKMKLFAQQALFIDYQNKMTLVHNFAENSSSYSDFFSLPRAGEIHHYGNMPFKSIVKNIVSNNEIFVEIIEG